ncbi:MAG: DUF389 domain-containing protein [Patescibacteria group bacterium]|nr:DUF389 domain-containing protein [Patescibacteria group bacterium]MDE1966038.1 DUF389 domain-containing protein [Patescibacteria group bacterium]
MFEKLFRNVTGEEKADAIERIIQHASPRQDFFLMMMLAIAMATVGVLVDSSVVLIGSMLIAPMLYPLLSLALGIVLSDGPLLARSLYTLGKSVLFALAAAIVIGVFFTGTNLAAIGIVTKSVPSLMYALVAGIAGFAAAFAMTKPNLNEMLPGVAISVSLVPPLAVAGVGLAHFNWAVFANSFLLFLINVVGIVLFATVVFSLFGFSVKRQVAEEAVKAENKVLKAEAKPLPASKADGH